MEEEKLVRFLNNRSSPKERKDVMEWLEQPGAGEKLEEMLSNRWEKSNITDLQNEARYHHLLKKIHLTTLGKEKPKKAWIISRRLMEVGRTAATYLLFLFSAYLLFQSWKPIIYGPLAEKEPFELIERKTMEGEKLRITLPDQSRVILNSLSTLSFDSDFGKKDRIIQLEGEAYFEITPDKNRPFMVKTGEVVTTALGTAFNTYSRYGLVEISLTEGKVRVSNKMQEVELIPGEMAAKENIREDLDIKKFDPNLTTAWKEGKIRFKSKPLGEILLTLEEWYGVDITVHDNIDQGRKVTGIFDNESLEGILNGLSYSMGLEQEIKGINVTLKPKGQ